MNYTAQTTAVKLTCESAETGKSLVLGKIFQV